MNTTGREAAICPEGRFFLIDSEHPEAVRPGLYGYYLQGTGIVTEAEYAGVSPGERGFSDLPGMEGAFLLIEMADGVIRLSQDRLGCWGIYLYRREGRFILSNSFLYLAEYLQREGETFTLDLSYFRHMLAQEYAVQSFDRTPLKEVRILDRRSVVRIDSRARTLELTKLHFKDSSVSVSSKEGIRLIDAWAARWTGIISSLAGQGARIRMDLSGGFDTRLLLMLFLLSGADLGKLAVYSADGELPWQKEDRRIAEMLAERYGFSLAQPEALRAPVLFDAETSRAITEYIKADVHLQLREYRQSFFPERLYAFGAYAGETIRGGIPTREGQLRDLLVFLMFPLEDRASRFAYAHSPLLTRRGLRAGPKTQRLRRKDMRECSDWVLTDSARKTELASGRKACDPAFLRQLDLETFRRWHCGKNMAEQLFTNTVPLEPMYDAGLWQLKLSDGLCRDQNLLYAVIMTRYCPELLELPFQGERSILPETVRRAEEINRRYPLGKESGLSRFLKPRQPAEALAGGAADTTGPGGPAGKRAAQPAAEPASDHSIEETILEEFTDPAFQEDFCAMFGRPAYQRILRDSRSRKRYPLTHVTPAVLAVRLRRMGAKL